MNILKNNSYYFMKLITVCELIILLMSRDIKTRYNGNLLNYMMVLAVPLVWISITVISFQYLNRSVPISTDDISFVIAG
ncbi:TPA: Vi polysaccharide ABC transporter inner membrane protein VexB, partial [Salmonella enterica subsp. enterica serovar Typhi str. CT18]|nr:Vi polysaccharide ABC transporter inner membrane protein VexB [Salmonella enterica subsp. enterica serovar Typhi str. CT18]HCC5568083.1 Vi polysaccharide ABC transporter inner membrane protein VexB [Salmonella enterica subsp. enterica serovar Typhi str. CT18]